ncbi:MAG: hypothetical protein E5V33_07750 [Mesorhizobium sp.]|nr:MAG: hypothetical protein E5W45_00635 [Mesorhizobium sp.]TIX18634.1 MAG: hypothetical protein E5V44_03090 [Mesorhizobium sp.]TIX65430.1 MAG: hypothetical protein E5V33_07750 [Mesorhizobium sp.]TJW67819.1 MAG: hypothetical protein E5V29_16035 [Mesorhizobium sp.]
MLSDLIHFAITVPVIDLSIATFFIYATHASWRSVRPFENEKDTDERTLGATVILAQLGAVITGSSIILAGIAAFVALAGATIGELDKFHILYAAVWAVFAMALSLFTMSTLPHRTPTQNFVKSHGVAVLCSAALYFCLASSARFLVAVGSILF